MLLCRLSDLDATGARGVETWHPRYSDIIVLRDGATIRAYLNSCPHQGAPLETFPNRFLDETGRFLICSMHGARFRVNDGYCVSGPCKGACLKALSISLKAQDIYLDE